MSDKRAKAEALRCQGLSYKKIAARLGVGSGTVYRWLNPEAEEQSRAAARAWKARARGVCPGCGGSVSYDRPGGTCRACADEAQFGQRRRKVIAAWIEGVPTHEIAVRVGMSTTGVLSLVNHWRLRHGVDLPLRRRRDREAWEYILRRWNDEGASGAEIAAELGTTQGNVGMTIATMRRAGLEVQRRVAGGVQDRIEAMYNAGAKPREIAEAVGWKPGSVYTAISRLRRAGRIDRKDLKVAA